MGYTDKYLCDGHEYTFLPDTNQLRNNYGTIVAHVVLASDSNFDEYNHFIDDATGETMLSMHENTDLGDYSLAGYLVHQYVAFNS